MLGFGNWKRRGECPLNLSDYEVEKSGDGYVIVYCQTEDDGTQTLWMVKGTGFEWAEPEWTEPVQIAKIMLILEM